LGTLTTLAFTRSSRRACRNGTIRGSVIADAEGKFQVHTIQPAPYQIPTDGTCGALIATAGWHAWRPAHTT
jgi:protocatechuate 3,4-dioxygenase beta subunit